MDWLFKFSRVSFTEGEIGFQAGGALFVFVLLVVLLVIGFVVVYGITKLYTSNQTRAVSLGLRIPILLLLALPLFEPVLIRPEVIPDENFVAVVVDKSASMRIADGELGPTRADDIRQLLYDQDGGLSSQLGEHFKVRYYHFDQQAERMDSLDAGSPEGAETNIALALQRVLSDFQGLPLTGVVLMTDGGDNSTDVPRNEADRLRNRGIPLHIVGVGQSEFEEERELLAVTATKAVEENTGAEIDVKIRSWMSESGPVNVHVYQGETLLHTEARPLKGNGKIDQFSFFFEPKIAGVQVYRVELEPTPTERNTENNTTDVLIDTRKDPIRVLYFEGTPRRDFKFVKRALEDDQVISFVSVTRTGTGKIYRQGIESAQELAGGFPIDDEELYGFRAVVLGDIEAGSFSPEQLRLIERFVRVRGGGLLMLGGLSSFAEGEFWNTPVADVLPVELDPSRRTVVPPNFSKPNDQPEERGFAFQPTAVGLENPILKLSPDEAVNRSRWAAMPGLTSINYLGPVKPGAVVLAQKPQDDFGDEEPLLAIQRYGKGRSAALATASTWRWQMLLPADDLRHERFWRQLIRWLAASTPQRVDIELDESRYAPGDEVTIPVNVYTPAYDPLSDANVQGTLTAPNGQVQPLLFLPELTTEGNYVSRIIAPAEGLYQLDVFADVDGVEIGRQVQHLHVRPSNKEFIDATLKQRFLENLAETAGGGYYSVDQVDDIAVNLTSRRTSTSVYRAEYVWDMPFLLGLILLLFSAEWIYRRRKGLP